MDIQLQALLCEPWKNGACMGYVINRWCDQKAGLMADHRSNAQTDSSLCHSR